ncbi:hypothetical protein EBBID32_15550 [Sphingobium indicum BiD32]|uniref:Uncharacterized protein n=1 Tax=Sphingobium indicum BiD32 TaxID=1301087 RepID=N1MJU9_9SPHN|nr:hypothetical protein EBBID32_15550 [Sphingobium indicum BiD32]
MKPRYDRGFGDKLSSAAVAARIGDYARTPASQRVKVPSAQFFEVTRKSTGGRAMSE